MRSGHRKLVNLGLLLVALTGCNAGPGAEEEAASQETGEVSANVSVYNARWTPAYAEDFAYSKCNRTKQRSTSTWQQTCVRWFQDYEAKVDVVFTVTGSGATHYARVPSIKVYNNATLLATVNPNCPTRGIKSGQTYSCHVDLQELGGTRGQRFAVANLEVDGKTFADDSKLF